MRLMLNSRERLSSGSTFQRKENVSASKFTNSAMNRYTYDMRVYLGRDSHFAADGTTATHATVRHLTSRVEGLGHKIFMDNFFSSPGLFDDLDRHKINFCGQCGPTEETCPVIWTKTTEIEKG